MDELAKAMETRGFLICRKNESIYFSQGNSRDELKLVVKMFKEIGCEFTIENREIYIHTPLSAEQLQYIIWYPASNQEARQNYGLGSWKYFVKRRHGAKVNTFVLETGVALLVKSLSATGISTFNSCDGHGEESPVITFNGHIQGIWFDLLLSEIKKAVELHYDWKVNWNFPLGPTLMAEGNKEKGWNLIDVLEDTTKMAEIFLENAEQISKTKREVFGTRFKSTRKLVKTMDTQELHKWMSAKYKQHEDGKLEMRYQKDNLNIRG